MKPRPRFLVVLFALAALCSVQAAAGSPANPPPPRNLETIRELYQHAPPDGSRLPVSGERAAQDVAAPLSSEGPPAWSRLAFASFRHDNWDIYAADVDGLNEKHVTVEPSIETAPALARGGQQIAYASQGDGNYEIYRINYDSTFMQRLTFDPGTDTQPSWSPDGRRIAFQSNRAGNVDVWVMNADGSGQTRLTDSPAYDGEPCWSPDGSRLAFVSARSGRYELWVMDASGANPQQLTVGALATAPSWSPSGNPIAFASDSNGDGWLELWRVNSDGSALTQVLPSASELDYHSPAWSPDGLWLAYIETDWIYWEGNWYWYQSNLLLSVAFAPTGSIAPINDDRIWFVDWTTTDVAPPSACILTASAWHPRWSSVALSWTAQDVGGAGVVAYDVQARYDGLPWQNVVTASAATTAMHEAARDTVEFRCRARDAAGNIADWASAPITRPALDSTRPTSRVTAAPRVRGTQVTVTWSGTDAGSGIASYDIWVRDGADGDWSLWLPAVTTTTATFAGTLGHTYSFGSQARDRIGLKEAWRAEPKATVLFYAGTLAGTVSDNRGIVAVATPQLDPPAAHSMVDPLSGAYSLDLGASATHTLTVQAMGYGTFPPTLLQLTTDATLDIVLPPAENALINGGWETGTLDGWWVAGSGATASATAPYAGRHALQLSPVADPLEVSQHFTVDAALHEPTLSFLYRVPQPLQGGGLTVEVVGAVPVQVLFTSAATDGWQHAWADLAPYAGQMVTVAFRLSAPGGTAAIDEVSVGSWTTPQVSAVSPPAWSGQATTLFITGTNFISTPVLFLGDLPLSDVTWVDSTHLHAAVPAGMPYGQYTLRLANPGGAQALWSRALSIQQHVAFLPFVTCVSHGAVSRETTDWLTLGSNPGRTGYQRLEPGASRCALAWSRQLPDLGGRGLSQAAVADGVLVVSSDPFAVVGLDAETGQELWRYPLGGKDAVNPPSIAHGAVYVQVSGHQAGSFTLCLDLYTGQKIWQSPFAAQWNTYFAPLIVDYGVYVAGGYNGGMYRYDAVTGAQVWFENLDQFDAWTPGYLDGKVYSWVGGALIEHDPATGRQLWNVRAPFSHALWSMDSAPVLHSRTGLVASYAGLSAIDLDAREVRWSIEGDFGGTFPAVANGVVYAFHSHQLEARRLSDGVLLWTFAGDGELSHQPIVTGRYIYVGSNANTYVLSRATHAVVWQVDRGGWLTLANGYLYLARPDKTIYAYMAQEP